MPNGGSDCCGTCWFNRKNKGEAGYEHTKEPEENYCNIRLVAIENPFWTYCANHPYRCPDRNSIPIGPIYVDMGKGRELWQLSPDSESVRVNLLDLLGDIHEIPKPEYSSGLFLDEVVVWQLGEFQEKRALAKLVAKMEEITKFNPAASVDESNKRTRENLIDVTNDAVAKILG